MVKIANLEWLQEICNQYEESYVNICKLGIRHSPPRLKIPRHSENNNDYPQLHQQRLGLLQY